MFVLPKAAADFTNRRYGRLTVICAVARPAELKISSSFVWKCLCDCGTEKLIDASSLKKGSTKSCGCLKREANWNHRGMQRHGMHLSTEYNSWKAMIRRCTKSNFKHFEYYGGRGIVVCERWRTFDNFIADMGMKPSLAHTLDRYPDKNGGYEPGNCRWATKREQSLNMSRNFIVSAFGISAPLAAFFRSSKSKQYNQAIGLIRRNGWNAEKAIRACGGMGNGGD